MLEVWRWCPLISKNIFVIADIWKIKAITASVVITLPVDVLAPHGSRPSSVTVMIMFCCQVANFGATCGTIGGHFENLYCRQWRQSWHRDNYWLWMATKNLNSSVLTIARLLPFLWLQASLHVTVYIPWFPNVHLILWLPGGWLPYSYLFHVCLLSKFSFYNIQGYRIISAWRLVSMRYGSRLQ